MAPTASPCGSGYAPIPLHPPLPPWIELLGLPGSGKTTALRAILDALRAHGAVLSDLGPARTRPPARGRAARLRHHLRLAAGRPHLLRPLLRAGLLPPALRHPARALAALGPWLERLDFIHRRPEHALLITDEGVLQGTWSVLNRLHLPGSAAARLQQRGQSHSRFDRPTPEGQRAFTHAQADLDALIRAYPGPRWQLPATTAPETLAHLLLTRALPPTGLTALSAPPIAHPSLR